MGGAAVAQLTERKRRGAKPSWELFALWVCGGHCGLDSSAFIPTLLLCVGRCRRAKNYISQTSLQLRAWMGFRSYTSEELTQEVDLDVCVGEMGCRATVLPVWMWLRRVALEVVAVVSASRGDTEFPAPVLPNFLFPEPNPN